ncbi:MAG TPA: hypothetical protein VFV87_11260 [Pirellulaceae bacterium]|nr:hypothetical protein [Pirellulaceae bacterium]
MLQRPTRGAQTSQLDDPEEEAVLSVTREGIAAMRERIQENAR